MKFLVIIPLCLILFLFLLTLISCKIRLVHKNNLFTVRLKVGLISYQLYPMKLKKKTKKKDNSKETKKKADTPAESESAPSESTQKRKLTLDDVKTYATFAIDSLKKFKRKIVITDLVFTAKIHNADAAKAAISCGTATAAASAFFPVLEGAFKIKKAQIDFIPDFEGCSDIFLDVTFSAQILKMLIVAISILFNYNKIKNAKNITHEA